MKLKYIKLINNERLSKKIGSNKACTYDDTSSKCITDNTDFAVCTVYSNDICSKEDHAGCTNNSNDYCTYDHAACYEAGSWDYCYTDLIAGED